MSQNQSIPLVDIRGVHKAFGGVQAVENVSVSVHPGEVFARFRGRAPSTTALLRHAGLAA